MLVGCGLVDAVLEDEADAGHGWHRREVTTYLAWPLGATICLLRYHRLPVWCSSRPAIAIPDAGACAIDSRALMTYSEVAEGLGGCC